MKVTKPSAAHRFGGVGLLAILAGAAAPAFASPLDFTPLPTSAVVGSLPADQPFLVTSTPGWTQQTLFTNAAPGLYRAGGNGNSNFDQIAVNQSGPNPGRYVFTVNETGDGGVVRYDRITNTATQIVSSPILGTNGRSLDPVRWTPWGTVIFGEEVNGGRLLEIMNPLAEPASIQVVDRPKVGRSSMEGWDWDAQGNFYYQDEDNGGGIYKFVPNQNAANFNPNDPSTSPLASGQIFTLRIDQANTETRTGTGTWVALNNPDGTPINGIPDPTVNARTAGNAVNATNYRRPEDMHLMTKNGRTFLIVASTTADSGTTNEHVYSIELLNGTSVQVRSFVDSSTIDLATGLPVDASGNFFQTPDNIAFDAWGDVWIVEDNEPGDIWRALDADGDGVAESIARFASLSTPGAEPTGMFFNPYNPYEFYVNVQHPSDRLDRMILFTFTPQVAEVSEPATLATLSLGLLGLAGLRRRRGE
jgi:hypothetical protein